MSAFKLCGSLATVLLVGSVCLTAGAETPFRTARCEGLFPHHLQGIATNGKDAVYWCFTTALVKTDAGGTLLKRVPVQNHHGDLCYRGGKLYVAVNLGKFNDPRGNADCWVYVYDAGDLSEIARHEISEVVYGAGGIACRDGHFFVVGGLPDGLNENYVYEYDERFMLIKRHVIDSGHTHLGIQTATFADRHFWFGCYGDPKILLKTGSSFELVGRYEFDCSLGIEGLGRGQFLVARGSCAKDQGCTGDIAPATPDPRTGLVRPASSK